VSHKHNFNEKFLVSRINIYTDHVSTFHDSYMQAETMVNKKFVSANKNTLKFLHTFFHIFNLMEEANFCTNGDERLVSALLHATGSFERCYEKDAFIVTETKTFDAEDVASYFFNTFSTEMITNPLGNIPIADLHQIMKYAVRVEVVEYLDDKELLNYDDSDTDS
jgi:hypothetical protein